MHQMKKGKQWYFGMKAHVGVDSKTKIIHTAVATAANVADSVVLPDLLHGEETRVWGDQAYRGQTEVIRECAPQARDCTHRRYRYKHGVDEVERAKNRSKSTVRSKVEHVFAVMKLKFGFVKLRFRGLKKKCHPTVRGVRTGESVLGAEKTVASGTGLAPERRLLITGEPPKQAEDRKKPNPSACTGLAEHLLPRRHGLIQSFPKYISTLKRIGDSLAQLRSDNVVKLSAAPQAPQPATTPDLPPDFSPLISDAQMKAILERRWVECTACVAANAPLAATVMMGGLLEGLLLARV